MANDYTKGKKAVDRIIEDFYVSGDGKDCELCRMRGTKKRAFAVHKIEDIDYYLCWDCALSEQSRNSKDKRKK
jgi:hypothetical protein